MISVIIPTLNRAVLLKKTLTSVCSQTLAKDKFEVIVVDNGSTDNTKEVVEKFRAALPNLSYVFEAKAGLHESRHRGLRESRNNILTFSDDDIEAFPTWLEGISETFQDDSVGLVGGKNIPAYETTPPSWIDDIREGSSADWYITYFSLLDFGDEVKEIPPHFVFGCNFSIRKELLVTIGGFHPDGMPASMLKYRGDGETFVAEQVEKLGYRTIYNPKASVKHWVPASRLNIDYLKKRAYAEGITQSYMDTRRKNISSSRWLSELLLSVRKQFRLSPANPLLQDLQSSHREGYSFHQKEMKKNTALRDWVLKERYL